MPTISILSGLISLASLLLFVYPPVGIWLQQHGLETVLPISFFIFAIVAIFTGILSRDKNRSRRDRIFGAVGIILGCIPIVVTVLGFALIMYAFLGG